MEVIEQKLNMNETIETKLEEICNVINGTWHRQSLYNSDGELSERIIISYPSLDISGVADGVLDQVPATDSETREMIRTTLKNSYQLD
jgi:hypothetical protein